MECCQTTGLWIWSWNACTIPKGGLSTIATSFDDSVSWDAICIQEGERDCPSGFFKLNHLWVASGQGDQRGAPQILLNPRLGSRVRRTRFASHHVIVEIGLRPPLLLWTFYAPPRTHGEEALQASIQLLQIHLEELGAHLPHARLAGGMDLNTQLSEVSGVVGPWTGSGERPGEAERAGLVYGFLQTLALKLPSTFSNVGFTRQPWTRRAEQQQSTVIDFLALSKSTPFSLDTSRSIPTPFSSDHKPIGMFITARTHDRQARRRTFEMTLSRQSRWDQKIPTAFCPAEPGSYLREIRTLDFTTLSEIAPKLREVANHHRDLSTDMDARKKALLQGLRSAENPWTRKAFQWQLRQHQNRVKERKEHLRLLEWARTNDWGFSKPHKLPGKLAIPSEIDGNRDRGSWGDVLGKYMSQLYSAPQSEKNMIKDLIWQFQNRASQAKRVTCDPHDLRNILTAMPAFRAPGLDGIPSQCLKDLGWKATRQIAALFSDLANHVDICSNQRPIDWNTALVYMLPKTNGVTQLAKHRPISLMSQVQKLFTRWIVAEITMNCDQGLVNEQHGYRRCRQAPEVMHSMLRVLESQQEWGGHITVVKLDLQKAFDTVFQSAILQGLAKTPAHPRFLFSLARELIHSNILPDLWGTRPDGVISLERGCRQGAPESGLFFLLAINETLKILMEKWEAQHFGVQVGKEKLKTLIFVDDIILLTRIPEQAQIMIRDLQEALSKIGLRLNSEKTSYLTTLPARAAKLPGSCLNKEGLLIVGRRFRLQDNTSEELSRRINSTWAKFGSIRHILRQPTALKHRLKIVVACLYQSLLWSSESWHVTRRRCQHAIEGTRKENHEDSDPMPRGLSESTPKRQI